MIQDYSNVKVGDTVWWTDVNRKGMSEGLVTKVGSKLITVDQMAFRRDSGSRNDNYQHQHLIVDRKAHEDFQAADKAFQKLRMKLQYRPGVGVTLSDIHAAASLLKINLED